MRNHDRRLLALERQDTARALVVCDPAETKAQALARAFPMGAPGRVLFVATGVPRARRPIGCADDARR